MYFSKSTIHFETTFGRFKLFGFFLVRQVKNQNKKVNSSFLIPLLVLLVAIVAYILRVEIHNSKYKIFHSVILSIKYIYIPSHHQDKRVFNESIIKVENNMPTNHYKMFSL